MGFYSDYIWAALLYNLQLLPESLISGIIILSIVLVSKTLIFMAAGAALTQLLTSVVGKLIMKYMEGNAEMLSTKCPEQCHPGFIGKAMIRLANGGLTPELLWSPIAPSVYMATVGYFVGVGLALLQLYREEIEINVVNGSTLLSTTISGVIILIMALLFRVLYGCETLFGAVGGILLGLLLGYMGCITLGYITDRRATNVWGIPLIRDRINSGSALYVCPKD